MQGLIRTSRDVEIPTEITIHLKREQNKQLSAELVNYNEACHNISQRLGKNRKLFVLHTIIYFFSAELTANYI